MRIGRRRDADIVISFVVFQQDVVFGSILLDQGTFEYKGLELAAHHDGIKMVYPPDHLPDLFGVVGIRTEILAHPVFQRFGLADIENVVVNIFHNIHAGDRAAGPSPAASDRRAWDSYPEEDSRRTSLFGVYERKKRGRQRRLRFNQA